MIKAACAVLALLAVSVTLAEPDPRHPMNHPMHRTMRRILRKHRLMRRRRYLR